MSPQELSTSYPQGRRPGRSRGQLLAGPAALRYGGVFLAVFLVIWTIVALGGRRVDAVGEDARLVVAGEAIPWKGIVVPGNARGEAVEALRTVVGKRVRLDEGWVFLEDRNLSAFLVARGLARVAGSLQGRERSELESLENEARTAGRGIWRRTPP